MDEILMYFPNSIYNLLKNAFNQNIQIQNTLQEIRIRVGKPIILKLRQADVIVEYIVSQSEILQTLEKLCENSIYAYKNQICEGFLTIKGGHRIGITGTAVTEESKIINIKYVTSLNFRIARQVLGCSNKILNQVIDFENNNIFNTIIASPPGKGKTTILRDLIRRISDGIEELNFKGKTCGVVDERWEIAAIYRGIPQNDVGLRTDILDNVSKSLGMRMAVRTMAPKVIVTDEIGTEDDVEAINYGICSGVKGIFTAHGSSIEELKLNTHLNKLYEEKIFNKIIFLEKRGIIKKVYTLDKNMYISDDEK